MRQVPRTQKGLSSLLHYLLQALPAVWSRTKQVKLLLGSGVRNKHVLGGHGSLGTHSALRYHVKTQSNSFHSSLCLECGSCIWVL